ncbi:Kelch repeat-containing protein [Luteimonas aestuarii]|nr:kelch repeat-containing protein [Luteimonas aestuarii]
MQTKPWLPAALAGTCAAAAVFFVSNASTPAEPGHPRLVQAGTMSTARAAHQATLLDSGQVLVTGGCGDGCSASLAAAELYEPSSRAFAATAPMSEPRNSHVAASLPGGRVLVAGGWSGRGVTGSAEIFEPAGRRFVPADSMAQPRAAARAAHLADGRVLVVGGQTAAFEVLASAEIFDPATSRFTGTRPMSTPRVGHAATALADGRVLVTGGAPSRRGDVMRSAELYDPRTGRFERTGDMLFPRRKHASVLLADGRVLVIGGSDGRDQQGRYHSTEWYDPATGRFTPGPDMHLARFKLPDAVVVSRSGDVVVAGGDRRVERLRARQGRFQLVDGGSSGAREFATATLLANGDVLVLGGYDERIVASASVWLLRAEQARLAQADAL